MKILKLALSLIWLGIVFQFSAALTENADYLKAVRLNLGEQSALTDALVSPAYSGNTHCLTCGGARF